MTHRYLDYKPSGIQWLGDIPSHWVRMSLKYSLAMPITDGPHETPEILSEGIPFISAEAVKNDKLDFNKKRGYISEEDNARFSKKYSPLKGDIYMVKSGATTGNVARVETDEIFNIWSPLAVMRPNRKIISTDFLFYVIKSNYFNISVQLKWNMGTQQNIGMGVLSNIRIFVPSLTEQTAIAEFLDRETAKIDALLQKQAELLAKLSEKRTALITHAVTKGLNPNVAMKNSGVEWLGDIPNHWIVANLRYFVHCASGDFLPSDEIKKEQELAYCIPVIGGNGLLGYTQNSNIIKNCLAIGRVGALCGNVHYIDYLSWVNDNALILKLNTEKINLYFLYYLLIARNLNDLASKTAQPLLTGTQVKNEKIVIPTIDEQTAIAEFLDCETAKIDALCDKIREMSERLTEYRTTLISDAVTGKIKVIQSNAIVKPTF